MTNRGELKVLHKKSQSDQSKGEGVASINSMAEVDQFTKDQLDRMKIVYGGMQDTKILNLFRQLRTQLLQISNKNNFLCMVSSICDGGGASYVATNLASVFALDKAKTSVIIDANLYAPDLDKLVVGETSLGVTDYLSDSSIDVKDIVYATGVPRLRVIPIGENREGAAEYFSSDKMTSFADELRNRYSDRYIFIDAPPVTESPEARILSEIVDLVILVVPHGRVSQEQIEEAIGIVGKEKLSGLVYNN